MAEERREAKRKGEKERYTHLNAEFQRIAQKDKKAFLSDQCKEKEKNSRMGKERSPQENQRYQGNISCKDEYNKAQKWYGPNRGGDKNTQKNYTKKIIMTQITTMV